MLQVVKSQSDKDGVPTAVTRAVVDELVARRIDRYPADIVEIAKQCVTDFLAVTLAGSRESGSQAVAAELLDGRDGQDGQEGCGSDQSFHLVNLAVGQEAQDRAPFVTSCVNLSRRPSLFQNRPPPVSAPWPRS